MDLALSGNATIVKRRGGPVNAKSRPPLGIAMNPDSPPCPVTPPSRGLLATLRDQLRARHYSLRTERAYLLWVRRFLRFHRGRHPRQMGAADIGAFLSWLATRGRVAAATQNQALAALLFLYRHVMEVDLPRLEDVVRAKTPRRLPTVLTESEVAALLARMEGETGLMARLLYGSGLRIAECLALRVKDIDFERGELLVRAGKGGKDRVTVFPSALAAPMREQLARSRHWYEQDRADGDRSPERFRQGAVRVWGTLGRLAPALTRFLRDCRHTLPARVDRARRALR